MLETTLTLLPTLVLALSAGVATFFSPCAYPLLPGYVGFYASTVDGSPTLGGSLARGLVAGGGVLTTFAAVIGVSFVVGHDTLSNLVLFEPIVGALLLGFGVLVVLGRAPSLSIALPKRRSSVVGFGIFGAGYALAAAGCVAPLFVGVLTRALSLSAPAAALVIGTYVGTVTGLMIALTVATGTGLVAGSGWLTANTRRLERFAGAVMIVAGLGQLYLAIVILEVI